MKLFTSLLLFFMLPFTAVFAQKTYHVKSPGGKIDLVVSAGKTINWSVNHGETEVILPSSISMTLDNGVILGQDVSVKS
ncbi:MAG: glycoside hydrolase family 97 N-terminal domain-containing protein, partial [Mucilaginibacter sp.]